MTDFADALMRLWPNGDEKIAGLRSGIIATAPGIFASHGITTPLVLAHVMAQISHECGAGRDVVENLSYTAQRMMEVWPNRFPSIAAAIPYQKNPRALANKVYNGRMGNREGSNDGWNFRGRGGTQTTGRQGYTKLAQVTGLELIKNPDLVNDPKNSWSVRLQISSLAAACRMRDPTISAVSRIHSTVAMLVSISAPIG
jgi:putative chitinase